MLDHHRPGLTSGYIAVSLFFLIFVLGGDAARPRQAKEECLDDQPLAGGATGQRLRQPVLPEETEDGQGAQMVQRTETLFWSLSSDSFF